MNPTFLQSATRKWLVHYTACPLDGYLPLPSKKLDPTDGKDDIAFRYCRAELKTLLTAFRRRKEDFKFFFHPCDALVLCYQHSPHQFDIIDTSNLSDHIGPVNVINATARQLRSERSVLFTESMLWGNVAPDLAQYVEELLCCPLPLIPTIYGLRLIDSIELGSETLGLFRSVIASSSRLRWKKALPFDGVQLSISPILKECLEQLKNICYLMPSAFPSNVQKSRTSCGMASYSPLTFHYVLSDLIRRGGVGPTLMSTFFSALPPVYRKANETTRAWAEHRPVSRVKVVLPFGLMEKSLFDRVILTGTPVLRLFLVPSSDFVSGALGSLSFSKFFDLNSTETHFIDNLNLSLKLKSDGEIHLAEFTFLLEDCSLLESHCGLVFGQELAVPIFIIGRFAERQYSVEPFDQPYPWTMEKAPEEGSPAISKLISESCQESENGYSIRLKINSGVEKPPSG